MKLLYQCELCGTVYKVRAFAKKCETHRALKPCPLKVGDTITIKTRYDGEKKAIVEDVLLRPHHTEAFASWEAKGKKGINEFLKRWNHDEHPFHTWACRVSDEWQLGKDYYSDMIYPWNSVELKDSKF